MTVSAPKAPGPAARRPESRFSGTEYLLILLFLVLGLFEILTVQKIENYGPDETVYIVLAHNIRESGSYEFNFKPQTVFPPGLPLLLALASLVAGHDGYGLFVRLMPAFAALALIVWYIVLRQTIGRAAAAACCLLAATAAPLYQLVTRAVLSESLFFLVSGLTLLCPMALERPGWNGGAKRYLLLLGFWSAAALTVLVRTVGIAAGAALFVWAVTELWYRRDSDAADVRRRSTARAAIVAALAGLIAFLSWTGWARSSQQHDRQSQLLGSYTSQFTAKAPLQPELGRASAGDLAIRVLSNFPLQASYVASLAIRASYILPTWYSPLPVAVLALLGIGLFQALRDRWPRLLAFYFAAYFGIYVLWPYDEGPRFMLPVAPLAFAFVWQGLLAAVRLFRARPLAFLGAIAVLCACLAVLTATVHRMPGTQARVALVFWPLAAVASGGLWLLARRMGKAATAGILDSAPGSPAFKPLAAGIVGILLMAGLFQQAAQARVNLAPDTSHFMQQSLVDFLEWRRTADPDGLVMAQQADILHRLSNRKTIVFPALSDPEVIFTIARREHVRYLIVNDESKLEYFRPSEEERWRLMDRAHPTSLRMVHRGSDYRVFEFVR